MNEITDSTLLLTTILAALTFIHHVYGSIKYYTPKVNRLKIATLIAVMYIVTLILHSIHQPHWVETLYNGFILIWWVGGLGIFEGAYNHLVKVVLWAVRIPPAKLQKLFPPDEYVLPNDFIFESTGILTFLLGILVTISIFG